MNQHFLKKMFYKEIFSKLVLILFLIVSSQSFAQKSFSQIYVFGDSLSDTGNLASVLDFTLPDPPFYQSSRITNGPVAVEVMASQLGITLTPSFHLIGAEQGTNYAVVGGRASVDASEPTGLLFQISSFLANHPNGAPNDALYIMFIGANDVRDASRLATEEQRLAHLDLAIYNIQASLAQLTAVGAKHILIVDVPNIGRTPEAAIIAQLLGDRDFPKLATALVNNFNKKLRKVTLDLRKKIGPHNVQFFSAYRVMEFMLNHAEQLGFSNSTDACYDSENFQFYANCSVELMPSYFFFDYLHPTAKVHKKIGNLMAAKVYLRSGLVRK